MSYPLAATTWVEYEIDGARMQVPASVDPLSDDQTVLITAGLPAGLVVLDAVTWIAGDHRQAIDPARIQAR